MEDKQEIQKQVAAAAADAKNILALIEAGGDEFSVVMRMEAHVEALEAASKELKDYDPTFSWPRNMHRHAAR